MSSPIHRFVHVAAAGLFLAVAACGGAGEEPVSEEGDATETAEASGEASCVADFADSPCGLLTEDLVRAEFPDAPAEMEKDSTSGSMYSSCSYAWPSDRMGSQEVAGRTMEFPEKNTVVLSWIENYETDDPRAQFRREYLPTEQEMDRGRERMDEELDRRAEEGEMTEGQRELAGDVAGTVGGGMAFEPVEGVGDMASWNGTTLYVLDGVTNFQVEANVSADAGEDRAAAVEVANALMAACE